MSRYCLPLLLLFCSICHAQSDLAIGEWTTFYPYEAGEYVTQSTDFVYFASGPAIARFAKEDESVDFITTVDGLTEAEISQIRFSPFDQLLVVAYANSSIDLVSEDDIFNLNNIVTNTNIVGSRRINDIYIASRELAYLSTDFGIVELNLERREFGFTTFTPISVNSVIIDDGQYYAGTEEGLYTLPISQTVNPADFSQWTLQDGDTGLPIGEAATDIESYQNQLYVLVGGSVYVKSDTGFELFDQDAGFEASFLSAEGRDLLIGYRCLPECNGKLKVIAPDGGISAGGGGCVSRPLYAVQDEQGGIWYADQFRGFRRSESSNGACSNTRLNAPFSSSVFDIHVEGGRVYVATGGTSGSFNFLFRGTGFSILEEDGLWTNVNTLDNNLYDDLEIRDVLYILPDPSDPSTVYAGSYISGLVRYRAEDDIFIYGIGNSSLQGTVGTENTPRVSGMAYDPEGNLWMTNYLANNALSVFTVEEEWQNFELPSRLLTQMAVDQQGRKWMTERGQAAGFIIFDEGDIDDTGDDQIRRVSSSNSELPTNNVLYIAVDRDGDVWVGTDQGPVVFECGDPFDPNCVGNIRKVDQDGILGLLLETERINTIAVDGANRKWFGTDNGIFVQSANGDEQILAFNTDNSPLPSNQISDISIDQDNGEVWIGTASGIVVYRSDATLGRAVHEANIKVFPNPVEPGYDGPIAIDGLAEDALVKITDISGKIVKEVLANGGQAIWDGRDQSGVQVASGVYLVFSSTTDSFQNPDGAIAKIMYVR